MVKLCFFPSFYTSASESTDPNEFGSVRIRIHITVTICHQVHNSGGRKSQMNVRGGEVGCWYNFGGKYIKSLKLLCSAFVHHFLYRLPVYSFTSKKRWCPIYSTKINSSKQCVMLTANYNCTKNKNKSLFKPKTNFKNI